MNDPHFIAQQEATARWMGYDSVGAMNEAHDRLHATLCAWLGVTSHSLLCAAGEPHDANLAGIEEDAVLHVQKLMAHHKVGVPE